MIYLLAGYMWLFVHRPFEIWSGLAAFRLERVYFIVMVVVWLLNGQKLTPNRLHKAFAAFFTVMLVSWQVSAFHDYGNTTIENYFKVLVFYFLLVTSVRSELDLRKLIVAYLVAVSLYMSHSLFEYLNGRHVYRMGTKRMVGVDTSFGDPNTFAATLVFSLPLCFPFFFQGLTKAKKLLLIGFVVIAVSCVLLTGSRTGLVGLVCLAFVSVIWFPPLRRHWQKIIIIPIFLMPVVWMRMPDDLRARYFTIIDRDAHGGHGSTSADSRRQGWVDGVRMWKENLVLGVGPNGFAPARNSVLQSHQLYGQILGELGTLGAITFGMIILAFANNVKECRRIVMGHPYFAHTLSAQIVMAVSVTVVMMLLFGLGGHNLYRYTWLWFGAFQGLALAQLRLMVDQSNAINMDTYNERMLIGV